MLLLKKNRFRGLLPTLPKKLMTLELSLNGLEGEIPRSLCNNSDLEILETRPRFYEINDMSKKGQLLGFWANLVAC